MSAAYRHCVNGLLTSIVWTLIGRLYDVYITDIVYLLDVLVGEVEFLTEKKKVPGVLKRKISEFFFGGGGGGFWGRKTIHFFLWPWHVTG